jgi:hypothetical protein
VFFSQTVFPFRPLQLGRIDSRGVVISDNLFPLIFAHLALAAAEILALAVALIFRLGFVVVPGAFELAIALRHILHFHFVRI